MKKTITLSFLLLTVFVSAQKELWGVSRATPYADLQGNIVKFDMNGENAVTVHHFNYPTGKLPSGKLFLASNGKLYGTTTFGGVSSTTNTTQEDGNGVLYEYDMTFDTYRVVHYFTFTSPIDANINPSSSLIEPVPGKLYGGTKYGKFFVYDIDTETVTSLTHTYSFDGMGGIYSDLIKASNGFVYAVSQVSYSCTATDPQPNMGAVIKINTTTNTAQRVANFSCVGANGAGSSGTLVEALPNKIFFTSGAGYQSLPEEGFISAGTIVEFNTLTNTLTPRVLFDALIALGYTPRSFVMGDNDNLYGICEQGGDTYRSPFTSGIQNKTGTLFEYNPATNSIIKLTEFDTFKNLPQTIMKLTTGDLMGNLGNGSLFKYNINSNMLQFPDLATYSDFPNQFSTRNLLEICRKPAYHFFDVDTFDACIGGNFNYDVQNTNGASYQWKINNQDVVGQTTGVLNLTNLQANDAGDYTCVMTNECGTTTTMILHLTVSCLGNNTFANLDKSIKLYPNPTTNWLNIELPQNIDINVSNCAMTNLLGQTIYESTTTEKIDVSRLQDGIYIVLLQTNYGKWQGKFVKK